MKKHIFLLNFIIFLSLIISGCSSDDKTVEPKVPETLTVDKPVLSFEAKGGKQSFSIKSNAKWEILPENKEWFKVSPLKGEGDMTIEVEVIENKDDIPLSTKLTIKGNTKTASVEIKQDEAILPPPEGFHFPLLTINTENREPIIVKEKYLNATITLESRDEKGEVTEKLFEAETEIKGRGNSTWGMEKKPYRLKLNKSSEILGMPKSKHWVLLANYSDKTLLRNELAFEISRRMEYPYTPRAKYVDVILNGDYIGNYMLCEHIRIDKNRVNIAEMEATDTNVSGGYLLEIDERESEPVFFKTREADMTFCVNRPEDIPQNQKDYISAHIQKLEDALYGKSGNPIDELPKYLDLKSFIDNLLINEISKNVDGNLRLSTFVYKDRDNDVVYFGPVWDYDIAFGNVDYNGCETVNGWYTMNADWYKEFVSHPEFMQKIRDRWSVLRGGELNDLNPYIDDLAKQMEVSQIVNFRRWRILNKHVWPNNVVTGSYKGEIDYLKDWLKKRIEWMDQQLK
ncbi:CotH kinase family protein [Prevotella sp. 10(H)]|uniref:CotH kinase family protein n=1 Tax=Prevotella sp. 10(H) TaxID=1158294 RepID=UPI0004A73029|nr:CotH kinase family protein [Prevotella sp. 10(H)]